MQKPFYKKNLFRIFSVPTAIILFLICASSIFFTRSLDPDEGIILNNAWRFWNGNKEIYTDKFVEYLSPGSALSVYAFWKIFKHPEYIYAKLLVLVLWIFFIFGIVLIIRIYTKKNFLTALAIVLSTYLVANFSQVNHNPLSSMISVWSLYFLILLARNQYSRQIILILFATLGLFNALVLWFLQTKGIALFILLAIAISLIKKTVKIYLLFYLASFILCSLFLLSITGLKKTFVSLFFIPLSVNYIHVNRFQPSMLSISLALIILFLMFFVSVRRKRIDLLSITLFQLALFISIINNFNTVHFMMNLFPAAIFYIIYFSENLAQLNHSLPEKLNVILFLGILFEIVWFTTSNFIGANIFKLKNIDKLNTPQIAKAKNIYAGPFLAGYYYEARKTSFYPLSHTDVSNDYYNHLMLESFKEKKPEIAFLDYKMIEKSLNYNTDNPLDNYIRANYQLCEKKMFETVDVYVLDQSFCPKITD